MALVPFQEINYLEESREEITQQFKNKDIVDRYLQLFMSGQEDLQKMFKDLLQKRSIDEAKGAQLDVIGRIVGQPRTLVSLDVYNYFGYLSSPNSETFGDINDPSIGGYYYSAGNPTGGNYTLDDEAYRLFIKSKILKNQTAATPEELVQFIKFLFGQDIPVFLREGNAAVTVFFGRDLSDLETNLINYISYELGYPSRLIPKPVGVLMEYAFFRGSRFFAFQGVPNAKGFGDRGVSLDGWGYDYGNAFGGTATEAQLTGGYFASYLNI